MMVNTFPWITPLMKQCWVSAGVALNIAQTGFSFGLASTMVPQLRMPGSTIPVDEETSSWIASISAIALIPGNLIGPIMMAKLGRRSTHFIGNVILSLSWFLTAFATNVTMLLLARFLQGISMGIIVTVGPILVGEYTTPSNRGVFLMCLGVFMAIGVLVILTMGLYLAWRTVSFIGGGISLITLIIITFSPESPSWLANKGKYDDCIKAFHWLRGYKEEEELEKLLNSSKLMIEAAEKERNPNDTSMVRLKKRMVTVIDAIKSVEFYIPVIIMFHVYGMAQWSGVNIFSSYAIDLIHHTVGDNFDVSATVIWLNVFRTVSTIVGLVLIKKVKRKTLMYCSVGLNMLIMVISGVHVYARTHNWLNFDSFYIGIVLLYIHMSSFATGALPLSFLLSGELYPLEFKSLAGAIGAMIMSAQIFVSLKTIPFFLSTIQIYGIFWLYAAIQLYCLIVVGLLLPETKDKTLQDIEEEFKSKRKNKKEKDLFNPNQVQYKT